MLGRYERVPPPGGPGLSPPSVQEVRSYSSGLLLLTPQVSHRSELALREQYVPLPGEQRITASETASSRATQRGQMTGLREAGTRDLSEKDAVANYAGMGHLCGWPEGAARIPRSSDPSTSVLHPSMVYMTFCADSNGPRRHSGAVTHRFESPLVRSGSVVSGEGHSGEQAQSRPLPAPHELLRSPHGPFVYQTSPQQ